MSTIEISEELKGSPAEATLNLEKLEASLKLEASIHGSAPYTDEQLKAIRPIPIPPGSLILEAYHIPFRPIADPVAAAETREWRRKMFELTKAAFPDVPTGNIKLLENKDPLKNISSQSGLPLLPEMSTFEISEELKGSPAEATLNLEKLKASLELEASIHGSAPYTDEQLKAIRPIPIPPGSLGILEAYHIPFRPIADPVAAAETRERRRKMFALTKATFPDLRVPDRTYETIKFKNNSSQLQS